MAISSDNHWLVTGSEDGTYRLWDLTGQNPAAYLVVLRGHESLFSDYLSAITAIAIMVAISPDNRWLVIGSADSTASSGI